MKTYKIWEEEQLDNYIGEIKKRPNMSLSLHSNYLQEFATPMGLLMIVSFLVEYFYTKKPQCYILKTEKDVDKKFVDMGKKSLECCYIAYESTHIIHFIEQVIKRGDDPLKQNEKYLLKNL